jgi:adenosine deaminase
MVSRWERGENVPTLPEMKKIVDAYGLDENQAWQLYREAVEQSGLPTIEREALRAFRAGDVERMLELMRRRHMTGEV